MNEHAALNQRVWDWLKQRRISRRQVALQSGIKEGTLGRMLDDPTYQTDPENWRRLARFIQWDEAEILALAGVGPPPAPLEEDAATMILRILIRAGYADEDRAIILAAVRRLAPVSVSNSVSS